MELIFDGFPTLPTAIPNIQPKTQDTPDIGDFSDDSVEPSPTVTNTKPIQTTFMRLRDTISDSEDNPTF